MFSVIASWFLMCVMWTVWRHQPRRFRLYVYYFYSHVNVITVYVEFKLNLLNMMDLVYASILRLFQAPACFCDSSFAKLIPASSIWLHGLPNWFCSRCELCLKGISEMLCPKNIFRKVVTCSSSINLEEFVMSIFIIFVTSASRLDDPDSHHVMS